MGWWASGSCHCRMLLPIPLPGYKALVAVVTGWWLMLKCMEQDVVSKDGSLDE